MESVLLLLHCNPILGSIKKIYLAISFFDLGLKHRLVVSIKQNNSNIFP